MNRWKMQRESESRSEFRKNIVEIANKHYLRLNNYSVKENIIGKVDTKPKFPSCRVEENWEHAILFKEIEDQILEYAKKKSLKKGRMGN